jgi:hypothetical protein
MRLYEAEIREELAKPDTKTFRFAADWEQWNEHKHIWSHFYLLFYLVGTCYAAQFSVEA